MDEHNIKNTDRYSDFDNLLLESNKDEFNGFPKRVYKSRIKSIPTHVTLMSLVFMVVTYLALNLLIWLLDPDLKI